jgi:hypothetical protein
MRLLTAFILASSLAGCCANQLSGTVSTLDNEVVEGALVSIDGVSASARTNRSGRYRFRGLPCRGKPYLVRVTAAGYPEVWDEVNAPDGGRTVKDFHLNTQGGRDDSPVREAEPEPEPERESYPEPEPERESYPEPEPERESYPEPEPEPEPEPPPARPDPAPEPAQPAPARRGKECPSCMTFVPKGKTECPSCNESLLDNR